MEQSNQEKWVATTLFERKGKIKKKKCQNTIRKKVVSNSIRGSTVTFKYSFENSSSTL